MCLVVTSIMTAPVTLAEPGYYSGGSSPDHRAGAFYGNGGGRYNGSHSQRQERAQHPYHYGHRGYPVYRDKRRYDGRHGATRYDGYHRRRGAMRQPPQSHNPYYQGRTPNRRDVDRGRKRDDREYGRFEHKESIVREAEASHRDGAAERRAGVTRLAP